MLKNISRLSRQLKYLRLSDLPLLARIARNYSLLLAGKKVGRTVDILITYDCQCDCEHCLTGINLRRSVDELSMNEWKKLIDETADLGFFHYNFSGGEPLMSEKTYLLIDYLREKHLLSSVNTNGLLLDRENLQKLKKLGLKVIQVSLDSSVPEAHDAYRGYPGLYERALEGAREASRMGFAVSVNSMVTKERIENGDVLKLHQIVKDMGLIFQLEIPCLAGKYSTYQAGILNEEEREIYWKYINEHKIRNDHQSTYWKAGCDAGSEKITITPDGEVIPCSVIWISFGNVREEPVGEIWKRMRRVPCFQTIQPVCLAGMEDAFIEEYLSPLAEADSLPLKAERHPAISKYLAKDKSQITNHK